MVPDNLEQFDLFRQIMREVGETLEVSRAPEIVAAVKKSQLAINGGEIVWDEE